MGLVAIPRAGLGRAPAVAGAAALTGITACGALICLHAAAGASVLIPASWHGAPDWLSGHLPSPYGPLFTLGTYALAPLPVAASLWVLKAATAAASLAIVALVWDCARRLRVDPVPAAVLVGLNPLVLVWAVGGAHNDLIVTAAVVGGVWLAVAGRERLSGAALAGAAALKVSAGVMLPFLLAGARGRRRE